MQPRDGDLTTQGVERDAIRAPERVAASYLTDSGFATIFAAAPAAMVVTRLRDGLILDANDECVRLLGHARAAMIGRSSLDLGLWPTAKDRKLITDPLAALGMVRDVYLKLRTASGDLRSVRMDAQALTLDGERIVLATFVDATDVERRLRESDERFRAAFMTSSDACVIVRHDDGRILELNDRFLDMYGFTREECLGKSSVELRIWARPEQRVGVVAELERNGRVRDFEILAARKNGEKFNVLYSVVPLEIAGQPKLYVGAIRDMTAQYRARDELKRSEELLRRSHRLVSIGTFMIDLSRRLIHVSAELATLLGLDGEPLVMSQDEFRSRFSHPDDIAAAVTKADVAYRDGQELMLEMRIVRADSKVIWVRASSIAERNADGESVVIGVLQDITAAKLASAKVEYMNRLYLVLGLTNEAIARESDISAILKIACRVAVERGGFASAWIALLDSTGQRLHAAAGAAAVNGLCREFDAPDELCNSGITDRCRQSGDRAISSGSVTASLTQRSTEAAMREHFSSSGAFPLKVDGRLAGVFTFGSNEPELFTSSQELALFEQLAIDISFALETEFRRVERRLVDEALLESERKFRQIAENIDQVFWLADTSLRMLYVSPAYEKIWGRRVEPLVSGEMSWLDGVHAEDRSGLQDALETALRTGRCDQNYRICRPDGGVRWIKDRAFVLSDGTGSPYRIVGTASDVTEQRDLENHLRQVQKMEAVGVLAGGIAHDFNNVLVAILSYAALLLQDLRPGDPMRDDVLEIETAAERAADLTRQLLAFSRQQVLQPRVIDVDEVVSGMTRMLKRLIGDDIQLVASLCGTPATVYVDPGQMEQVLMNLAVNARDAMPQGGTLRIEVSLCELDASSARRLAIEGGAYVRLDVTDSGIGMDEATQARIFEPFFTTKPLGKGTGLGLSTVFGIVSQSGGAIDVESASEMGSTFHIWLPSATKEVEVQHPQPAPPESAVANRSHACGTILLVEDDEHVRRLAFAVLTKSGYQVFPVSSGGDALILWERQLGQIDLLLTDVVMPLMGGEELVHRFQQLQPGLRFILMSGYSERAVNSSTFPLSGVFLEKPFTPDKLLKCVADALSLAH